MLRYSNVATASTADWQPRVYGVLAAFCSNCSFWKDTVLARLRLAVEECRRSRVFRPDRRFLNRCMTLLLGSKCVAVRVFLARFRVAAEM